MRMKSNKGFTLIELLIVVAIIGIIAAIAIPGLMRARMAANEGSAIGSLRAINSGQAAYASSAGGGYAPDLATLGTACQGVGEGFVSPDLGSATDSIKSGYTMLVVGAGTGPLDCNSAVSSTSYISTATPVTVGTSGTRSFGSNQAGTIYFLATGATLAATDFIPANVLQ